VRSSRRHRAGAQSSLCTRAPRRYPIALYRRIREIRRIHRDLFEVRQRARLLPHAGVPDCGDRQWIAHRSSGLHRLIHDWLAERLLHDDVRRRVDCGPTGHRGLPERDDAVVRGHDKRAVAGGERSRAVGDIDAGRRRGLVSRRRRSQHVDARGAAVHGRCREVARMRIDARPVILERHRTAAGEIRSAWFRLDPRTGRAPPPGPQAARE